jgi:hypothetical protein
MRKIVLLLVLVVAACESSQCQTEACWQQSQAFAASLRERPFIQSPPMIQTQPRPLGYVSTSCVPNGYGYGYGYSCNSLAF